MKKLLCICSLALLLCGCSKTMMHKSFCTDGTIVWGGNPAADGLGWYIKAADGKTYIPENLQNTYKIDNLSINACLNMTGAKFQCQCATPLDVYRITSISKK